MKTLIREWRLRRLTRREIGKLDGRTIRDLGLCESQLQFEATKPFWRA